MSVARAQQCTHWEGEKFDVITTRRTKTAAVAGAADGHSCARRSAWRSGKKGEVEVDNDNNIQPYFGDAGEGVAWATHLQTQAG